MEHLNWMLPKRRIADYGKFIFFIVIYGNQNVSMVNESDMEEQMGMNFPLVLFVNECNRTSRDITAFY